MLRPTVARLNHSVDLGLEWTGSSQAPFAVSRNRMALYNREELYEKVWTMPLHRVAQEDGMSRSTIREVCKSLHIPAHGRELMAENSGKQGITS
jgi:hypothetical protein